jgi:cation transport regulator ChaC
VSETERWIFGYGSLVWRPAFAFVERAPGTIRGFARRFWQGSPDHRGAPDAPGRVVTLVPEPSATCGGMAYRVDATVWDAVLATLDERESGGFGRFDVVVTFIDPARSTVRGLVYAAAKGNPNFLGPAPVAEIAAQARRCRGTSGTNLEYVIRLAESLDAIGLPDPHVSDIAALLGASEPAG